MANELIIIIQFNSYLFTYKLSSPEANYKVSTSKKKQQQNTNKIQNEAVYTVIVIIIIIIQLKINNSIQFFIYLRADSAAVGHLQSQHGHIQRKQWTAQSQYTNTSGLYRQVLNVLNQ
jgi:hypothetical protein